MYLFRCANQFSSGSAIFPPKINNSPYLIFWWFSFLPVQFQLVTFLGITNGVTMLYHGMLFSVITRNTKCVFVITRSVSIFEVVMLYQGMSSVITWNTHHSTGLLLSTVITRKASLNFIIVITQNTFVFT